MINHRLMKLGKLPRKFDTRTLKLAKYLLTNQLPPPPPSIDYVDTVGANPEMYGNNKYRDCTCAAAGNEIKIWTANAGDPFDPTDAQVLAAYVALTGYNPTTGANNAGCALIDVLNYWHNTGIAGHQIGAFAQVNIKNHTEVQQAIQIFGAIYMGLDMPKAWQNAPVWDVAPLSSNLDQNWTPGSWGGHCVCCGKYDQQNLIVCTWGELQPMTWAGGDEYGDEWFVIISQDQLNPNSGLAPSGVDMAALKADLAIVTADGSANA